MIESKYLISPNSTIKTALKKMSLVSSKCLIVTNKHRYLYGTLSDGDIRKAFLKGKTIREKIRDVYFDNPIVILERRRP